MAGIYIKGMKMPKRCCACPFENFGECDVDNHDVEEACYNKERDRNCPLVSVPPHGALIDRAELWAEISKICDRREAGIITDLTCLQQLLSAFRHAPTVIPAEEGEG